MLRVIAAALLIAATAGAAGAAPAAKAVQAKLQATQSAKARPPARRPTTRRAVRRTPANPIADMSRPHVTTRASLMPAAHPPMLVGNRIVRGGVSVPVPRQPATPSATTSLTATVPTIEGQPGRAAGAIGVDPTPSGGVTLAPGGNVSSPPTPASATVAQPDGTMTTGAAPTPPR